MKTIKIFSVLLLIACDLLIAQEPDTLWTKRIGGDSIDVAYDVEELWDGGFAIVGYTKSLPVTNYDIWLIRTDPNGDTLWTKTYGGSGDDYGYSLKKTEDEGFIIGGTTNSFGAGGFDFYLIRVDSIGDTLWTRTFGDVNNDICWSVDKTIDGGFILAGEKDAWPVDADVWIIKTDSVGNLLWEYSYGTDNDDERILSIKKINQGSFIMAGASGCNGFASCDGLVIKLNEFGDTLWTRIFPHIFNSQFHSINLDNDGYIITGVFFISAGLPRDLWLVKTDSLGNEQWSQTLDYDNDGDAGYSVQQTSDGGYIIAGQTHPFDGGSLSWVVRTDSLGNVLWDKTFPYEFPKNPTEYEDGLLSVKQTMDGGYIVAGYQSGDHKLQVFLVRIASDIVPVELTSFITTVLQNSVSLNWQTATETNNSGFEIERTSPLPSPYEGEGVPTIRDGRGWKVIGFIPGFGTTTEPKSYSFFDENVSAGKYQYRLKQIDFDGTFQYSQIVEAEVTAPLEFSLEQNYPNPFNPTTKIKYTIPSVTLSLSKGDVYVTLKVYDVLGNEIATLVNETQQPGTYEVEFNLGQAIRLSSGVYYYQLRSGSFVETKKMIIMK